MATTENIKNRNQNATDPNTRSDGIYIWVALAILLIAVISYAAYNSGYRNSTYNTTSMNAVNGAPYSSSNSATATNTTR